MSQIVIITEGGLAKPHFLCDHCHNPIKEGNYANLIWEEPGEGKTAETKIVCKACDLKMKMQGPKTSWMDLNVTWWYLKNNSGFDLKESQRTAQMLSEL